ncbi:proline--tRNA ligase [Paenibacillus nasutitermitis]|uniref:Proline--tRNA ligase n=1 Tax=Paenibacillus nasutitermitis TaxID=1652958 RepID=A0A917DSL7_9BACL|nr:proline--tRNA ligase [Paenibacillus nasutitermitis]GGD67209.1 proline--tRNA ligase [Paenibacillus nasutitermitis]
MRQRHSFIPTLREIPADAEAISHQLMVKAGFIRQLAAGVYSLLPLGRRALRKVETIVREEMERVQGQELLLPALQPADLWQESGRYEVYGPELVRLHDRAGREFVLGPTHEEVITALVKQEINSYKRLPLLLYQIQTKFRDERRPRFGLLRCREFVMKDAYSFDTDWEGLARNYEAVYQAYHRIFERCGLNFRAVEADAGSIGGEGGTHEFMALAESGEDVIVSCRSCSYAANLEKAEFQKRDGQDNGETSTGSPEKFHTPGIKTIEQLAAFTGTEPSGMIKTLLYLADGRPAAVVVKGNHEANETKIKQWLGAETLELADPAVVQAVTGSMPGYAGPAGLASPVLLLVDRDVAEMDHAVAGANETDYHLRQLRPGRDFSLEHVGDFRNAQEGDHCPHCSGELILERGIELGHVFKLGTKYSEACGARFLDANGKEQFFIMGCYGIGVSRLLAAIVEQHHDQNGMIWPVETAPFHVHLIIVSLQDEGQLTVAERMYRLLKEAGADVLYDDRDERMGVKLKDADLIGLPVRIVVGKGIAQGIVEYKERQGEVLLLEPDEAIRRIHELAAAGSLNETE